MQGKPPRQLRKVASSIRASKALKLGFPAQLGAIHTMQVRFETVFAFILIHIAFDLDKDSL